MPGFDGTGPSGLGPMSGRGRGYCAVPVRSLFSANRADASGYSMLYRHVKLYQGLIMMGLMLGSRLYRRRGRGFGGRRGIW